MFYVAVLIFINILYLMSMFYQYFFYLTDELSEPQYLYI